MLVAWGVQLSYVIGTSRETERPPKSQGEREMNLLPLEPPGEPSLISVDRALVILRYLETDDTEVGVHELSRATGFSKSSVHRILKTLLARGFVKQNPANARYSRGVHHAATVFEPPTHISRGIIWRWIVNALRSCSVSQNRRVGSSRSRARNCIPRAQAGA